MPVEGRDRQNVAFSTDTQSTHGGGKTGHNEIQGTLFPNRWLKIGYAASKKDMVFNNLLTHINEESLLEAFTALDNNKAVGIDGISKKKYGENLEENVKDLTHRIHNGSYKPQPKREVLIPKGNGATRPIAISSFEDKLVEWVVGRILTILYEPLFIRNSFGFRPSKSAHNAIEAVYYSLKDNRRPYVVEIDFARFFNTIPHRRLMKIISKRISDNRFKGLVGRFMRVGILDQSGKLSKSEEGTPQGSIMSPVLANIYLHEMLDLWFIENYASYNSIIVRYADDALFFFRSKEKANQFLQDLFKRVKEYRLELNREKTKTIDFRKDQNNSFDFLGFTFYWVCKNNRRLLSLKTSKKTLHKKMQEFYNWVKMIRSRVKVKGIWKVAAAKLAGHYNYYGYWMNYTKLNHFYWEAIKSLYKWLNRRSQKKSFGWIEFCRKLEYNNVPRPPKMSQLKQLGWNPYAV
jgi:group II intron reverse transcriptase/maturase